jgi:hypothetical protein
MTMRVMGHRPEQLFDGTFDHAATLCLSVNRSTAVAAAVARLAGLLELGLTMDPDWRPWPEEHRA